MGQNLKWVTRWAGIWVGLKKYMVCPPYYRITTSTVMETYWERLKIKNYRLIETVIGTIC